MMINDKVRINQVRDGFNYMYQEFKESYDKAGFPNNCNKNKYYHA